MTLYQKFKKLKIDFSAIEFEQADDDDKYFCTPKGARIIGRAGVDGIHYCFVRGQEEIVFAVSPMNTPGRNVHPIARTFEDLLRLLLACGSMAALEQAHQWDEEQFEEYIAENQPTVAQLAVFDVLRDKLGITPMDEPFTYLRRLQDSYNYGELNYSKEYYEYFDAYPMESVPSQWKVTLDGGFNPERGKSGEELVLDKQFTWGVEQWYIPSAYLFSGGIVVDFFIELDTDKVKDFYNRYKQIEEQQLSYEEKIAVRNENPSEVNFKAKLVLNGDELKKSTGQSQTWVPHEIIDNDDSWEPEYARWILEHYNLDITKAWVINRRSFIWEGKRSFEADSIRVCLERNRISVPGFKFKISSTGEGVKFIHPRTKVEHELTVHEFEMQQIDEGKFIDAELEFPQNFVSMTYTIVPELKQEEFNIKDCDSGDSPRAKDTAKRSKYAMSVGAFAVIRSDSYATKEYCVNGKMVKPYAICSSLHFEPIQKPIEWRLVFREKLMEDIDVTLI